MALLAGGVVGYGFGQIQDAAARRYRKLQQSGQFNTSWAIVPGSMRRTAWLLVLCNKIQVESVEVLVDNEVYDRAAGSVVVAADVYLHDRQFPATC